MTSNRASGAAPFEIHSHRRPCRARARLSLAGRRCSGQLQHPCHDRIDRHRRGIHDHGVVGGPQRSDRAACVAPIALGDLQRKGGEVSTEALVFQLVIAPACALFGAGRQEDLEGGGGENHRPHVAAVGDQSRGPRKGPLALQQRRPDGRHGRDPRSALARLLGSDRAADLVALQPDLLAAVGAEAESDVQVLGDVARGPASSYGISPRRCPA